MRPLKDFIFYSFIAASIGFSACTSDDSTLKSEDAIEDMQLDEGSSNIMNFDGQLFSVPSPIQTAKLIKASGADYNNNLVNAIDNINNYNNSFTQAMNLGVYGADFAYVSYYGQDETSLKYMKNVKSLIDDLDLASVINEDVVDRIGENLGNQDSLMVISSEMFRTADDYLKNSERSDIAGLILTGGFIESLYFSTNLAKNDDSGDLAKRVGEQKQTVSSIVSILENNDNPMSKDLMAEFKALEKIYQNVNVSYEYNRPETDPVKKVTVIKSNTNVEVSPEVLDEILVKVTSIRTLITG